MSAKKVVLKFISSKDANVFVVKNHYSKKVAATTLFSFGCFLNNNLVGVLQYGRPINKRSMIGLVRNTKWNDFLELNRMVFIDNTPKNIESRSLAISFKLIKKHYPNIDWVISFADATRCGSGTIYRAAGFHLTAIKKNTGLIKLKSTKEDVALLSFSAGHYSKRRKEFLKSGFTNVKDYINFRYGGFTVLEGYQIRYIKLLTKDTSRINYDILDFKELDKLNYPDGVRHKINKRIEHESNASNVQLEESGAIPTDALQ